MPTPRVKKFDAWSYSRLKEWEECPRKAKLHHLDRISEPEGPALLNGQRVHKLAEDFALGKIKKIPPELARFKEEFVALVKVQRSLEVEADAAVTQSWDPCSWDDWNTVWLRGKLDVLRIDGGTAYVIDWKTGRVYPENVQQLDLYACVVFARRPEVRVVDARLAYLDQGEEVCRTYTRELDFARLKKVWEKRVKPMLADTNFAPKPGNACRFCWYSQAAKKRGGGGQCEF